MQDNTVQIDNRDEIVVNLFVIVRRVWRELRRNALKILLLAGLTGAVCYFGARFSYKPVYTANAVFSIDRVSNQKYRSGGDKYLIMYRVGASFPLLLKSEAVKSVVMDDLGYPDAENFDAEIAASSGLGTNLITLVVRSGDSQLAYDALQSVLHNFSAVTEPSVGEMEIKMISESGVPAAPSTSPANKKAAVMGMLFVLAAALVIAFIKCVFERKILTAEALSRALDTELLGTMPRVKCAPGKRPAAIDSTDCPPEMTDAVRTIRLRLEKTAKEHNAKTILVTSTLSAEGKTTAAANLALALAAHQNKVLLVDGNLRNPSILAALGMTQAEQGMADILAGRCESEKAMISYRGDADLTLLPGGAAVSSGSKTGSPGAVPAALWSSSEAERLFRDWRDRFDYILIDSSAAASFSESGLIARFADGCVYVAQGDRVQDREVLKGAGAVVSAGCGILGCVFNAGH